MFAISDTNLTNYLIFSHYAGQYGKIVLLQGGLVILRSTFGVESFDFQDETAFV